MCIVGIMNDMTHGEGCFLSICVGMLRVGEGEGEGV